MEKRQDTLLVTQLPTLPLTSYPSRMSSTTELDRSSPKSQQSDWARAYAPWSSPPASPKQQHEWSVHRRVERIDLESLPTDKDMSRARVRRRVKIGVALICGLAVLATIIVVAAHLANPRREAEQASLPTVPISIGPPGGVIHR